MTSSSYEPCFSLYRRGYLDGSPRVTARSGTVVSSRLTYGSYVAPLRGPSHLGRAPASPEVDLSQAAQVSSEFRTVRTQEKVQLQELNDRFAGFIEHVHELEQRNRALQAELLALQRRHSEPSRLRTLYEQETRQLRAAVEEARVDNQAARSRRDHLEEELRGLQARYEEEVLGREEAEGRLLETRKGADEATLARVELEKRADALLDELAFLKRLHESEVSELQAQCSARVCVHSEAEAAGPDLTAALRDIRAQYERLAQRNMQSAEDWFHSKAGALAQSAARHSDAARSARDEAGDCRRQLQELSLEIDACKGINQALERQLQETEERQSADIAAMQDSMSQLEEELGATKEEMARHLREYQDLLNVKMALDIEIAAYRKLLEGEETRFGVGTGHVLSTAPSYARSVFTPLTTLGSSAPYLLSTRILSTSMSSAEGIIGASRAQHPEASLPEQAPEEEMEEEEEEQEAAEEAEGNGHEEAAEGDGEKEEDKDVEEEEGKDEVTEQEEVGREEEEKAEKDMEAEEEEAGKEEEAGEGEGEKVEESRDADQGAEAAAGDEEKKTKSGEAEQAAEAAAEDEEKKMKSGEAEQAAEPAAEDEEKKMKSGEAEQAAEAAAEDEEKKMKSGEAEQAAETAGEDEEKKMKSGEAEQAAEPAGEDEEKKKEEKASVKGKATAEQKQKE